jgi:hypothetical protein
MIAMIHGDREPGGMTARLFIHPVSAVHETKVYVNRGSLKDQAPPEMTMRHLIVHEVVTRMTVLSNHGSLTDQIQREQEENGMDESRLMSAPQVAKQRRRRLSYEDQSLSLTLLPLRSLYTAI